MTGSKSDAYLDALKRRQAFITENLPQLCLEAKEYRITLKLKDGVFKRLVEQYPLHHMDASAVIPMAVVDVINAALDFTIRSEKQRVR